jgi:formate dehydrogenase iron-sulfur subunit
MTGAVVDTIVSHGLDIASHDPDGSPREMGFFTDTSLCIGCKACEVACKEWNNVPEDGLNFSGESYDNTGAIGCNSWRHVAFIEQITRGDQDPRSHTPQNGVGSGEVNSPSPTDLSRWLMASDVCKHCAHAACLDVCPTGALTRTEFGTVVVQEDVCNGCGYCVPACPFGVLDRREEDGRVWKCTLCYDRLRGDLEPACAKACPTKSIQFGQLTELRVIAAERVEQLRERGVEQARLYGEDTSDGVGGFHAFFLLLDEPEVYGLPPDPVVTTRDLGQIWGMAAGAAAAMVASAALAFLRGRR